MGAQSLLKKVPVFGNFIDNPEAADLRNQLLDTSAAYTAYRDQSAQAAQNAKANQLGAYTGYQNLLAALYGPGVLPQNSTADPMGPQMLDTGGVTVDAGEKPNMLAGIGTGAAQGGVYAAGPAMAAGPYGPAVEAGGVVLGGLLGGLNAATAVRKNTASTNIPPYSPYNVPGRK
jgi:hypothetical protein